MKIYLDMDGCIVNFNKGLHRALGLPFSYDEWPYTPGLWDYFDEVPGVSRDEINGVCDEDFWSNLDWEGDGGDILDLLEEKFGAENIYLLTCPMPNSNSWTGKYQWVVDHLPEGYEKRLIITRVPKWEFAGPDTILFDDNDENVNKFFEHGGEAVLIPRPWNSDYPLSDYTVETFKKRLEENS